MRKLIAVVMGYFLWSACWVGFNAALRNMGILPEDVSQPLESVGRLLALLTGSVLASVLAGYAVVRIIGKASVVAASVLGLLLLTTGIFVQAQYWPLMPVWYHLSFLGLLIPACLCGARLGKPKEQADD